MAVCSNTRLVPQLKKLKAQKGWTGVSNTAVTEFHRNEKNITSIGCFPHLAYYSVTIKGCYCIEGYYSALVLLYQSKVGLYVNSGSIYETPSLSGASHLLERLAFKRTTNRRHLHIVRELEAIGGHIGASASREQMGYTFDAFRTYVPQMVELLVDAVRNPPFLEWEVKEELKKVQAEIAELSENPQGLLLERIHLAGFSGAVRNPLLPSEEALNRLNGDLLEEFVTENYTAPRMVLAASGVDHEELLSIAEPLLYDLPSVPLVGEPKSQYVGGEYRTQGDTKDEAHIALAFEVPGGWRQEKQAIVLTVLQLLMGVGGSFSTGDPGKGMHSRLWL